MTLVKFDFLKSVLLFWRSYVSTFISTSDTATLPSEFLMLSSILLAFVYVLKNSFAVSM